MLIHEWAIDSIDNQGRISLRQIVIKDATLRPSNALTDNNSIFNI